MNTYERKVAHYFIVTALTDSDCNNSMLFCREDSLFSANFANKF